MPRILYAADIWCLAERGARTRTSKIGPTKALDNIATIQRAGTLAITGGLRTSATDALNAHAHLLPAALMVRKWCHCTLTRLATLPKEHPLYKIIKHRRTRKIKKHRGPIHQLTRWFKLDVINTEKIPTVARNPSKIGKIPIRISIADSREVSIEQTENTKKDLQVFSDSSALEGKVGVAAILIHKGRHVETLHYHLGSDKEHTVHEAELVGILLGMHLLNSRKGKKVSAMIGIDNQAAIKAFESELRNPGHHLAREALRIANSIRKAKAKGSKSKDTLTIQWTVGHEGIEGNELADKEAKEAAKGRMTDTMQLPKYLQKPILINPSAVKKAYKESLAKEW